jgi:hypothetical protein
MGETFLDDDKVVKEVPINKRRIKKIMAWDFSFCFIALQRINIP